MISLTLLPSQDDAKVGPSHPIVGRTPAFSSPQRQHKRSGISLDFGSRTRNKARTGDANTYSLQDSSSKSSESRIQVRLAEDSSLVPFLDRPEEVKDLLFETEQNKEFSHSLQMLFTNSPRDWEHFKFLLCEVNREESDDKTWLVQLYTLLFHRSPHMWCRLIDCLGAHGVDWAALVQGEGQNQMDTKEEGDDSMMYSDVFSEDIGNYMADKAAIAQLRENELEFEALHEVPVTFRSPPIRIAKHSYRQEDSEVPHSERIQPMKHRRSSSVISIGEDEEVHDFLSSQKGGFAGIRLSCQSPGLVGTSYQSLHSRSISAPSGGHALVSNPKESKREEKEESRRCSQLHKFTHHRRLSSLFVQTEVEEGSIEKKRGEEVGLTSLSSSLSGKWQIPPRPTQSESPRSSPTFARSFARFSPVTDPNITMTNAATERQPQSAPHESEEEEESRTTLGLLPDGRTRHPSAGDGPASKEAAALLAFKNELKLSGYGNQETKNRNRSNSSSFLSPPLSDDSFPTTVSPSGTSPEIIKKPLTGATSSFPFSPPAPTRQPPIQSFQSHLIFPIPPNPQFPRSKHLVEQLESKENETRVGTVRQVIGQSRYNQLIRFTNEHERDQLSDQSFLESIAKDFFHLVDQEKESRDLVEEHLLEEEYEQRFHAFVDLCHTWNVDNAVLRQVKRRSGPAVKLF